MTKHERHLMTTVAKEFSRMAVFPIAVGVKRSPYRARHRQLYRLMREFLDKHSDATHQLNNGIPPLLVVAAEELRLMSEHPGASCEHLRERRIERHILFAQQVRAFLKGDNP